jgi:hypothetical protein
MPANPPSVTVFQRQMTGCATSEMKPLTMLGEAPNQTTGDHNCFSMIRLVLITEEQCI